MMLGMEVWI